MKPSPGPCLFAAASLLALLCLAGEMVYGQEFAAADPFRFDMLPPGDTAGAYSFTLRSTRGQLTLTSVRVTEVRGPGGRALPAEQVGVEKAQGTADEAGTLVNIKPPVGFFSRPGEYRFELLAEGRSPTGAATRRPFTLLVTRPEPVVNLDSLKNQTIELTRANPFVTASGQYELYLREVSGKSPIDNLKVEHDSFYSEKNGALAEGRVTPKTERENGGEGASGQWVIKLSLSDFRNAGNFNTQLSVRSDSFEGVKTIPLKVSVKDHWALPLVALLLGVGVSYWASHVAENRRPRQLTRYKIVRAEGEANRLSRVVESGEKRAQVQAVLSALRDAEADNELGDTVSAQAHLDAAAKALDSLLLQQVTGQVAGYEAMKRLSAAVELHRQSLPNPTPEERTTLDGFADTLGNGRLEMLLDGGHVDEANESLETVRKGLEALKRARLRQFAEALRAHLRRMDVQDTYRERKTLLESRLSAAEEKVRTADVEEVKRELEEIAGEVNALAALLLEGFTDDASDAPLTPPIPSADEERQAADSMRIIVVESPDAWTTDAELTFVIENPNNELRDGDKFNWRFGNGTGKPTKKGTYSHTFRRPGTYAVEVDIVRGAGKWRTLSRPVVVRPSETDAVLDEIGRGLKRSEAVLAILAVVLAALSGLTYLYADKPFGTFQDYLLALLWGFGIDSSVRGFAGVFKNFTRQEGK